MILASYSVGERREVGGVADLAEELLDQLRRLDGRPARRGRGELGVGGGVDERLGELVGAERADVVGVGRAEARTAELLLVLGGEDDPQQLAGELLVLAGLAEMPMLDPPAKTGAGLPSLPGSTKVPNFFVVPLARRLAVLS